jgi:multidrug resistance efflux pump
LDPQKACAEVKRLEAAVARAKKRIEDMRMEMKRGEW